MKQTPTLASATAAAVLLTAAMVVAVRADAASAASGATRPTTRLRLSSGYDAYVHTYYLATADTTEAIGEYNVAADLEIRSPRRVLHQWHVRAELSAGTQLLRELVDLGYRWRPDRGEPRLRADLAWMGRQYRRDSDHALSSDAHETRGELRLYPWRARAATLDLRLKARRLDHRHPSILEQDQRDIGAAAFLASAPEMTGAWRVGALAAGRSYPDSTAINRRVLGIEGDLERSGAGTDLWLYHRSERRRIAHSPARPSAWLHWSELRLAVPVSRTGRAVANVNSEVWRYDRQTSVWFDAWRTDLELGYRWGDLLSLQRHAMLTAQHLAAGDSPEAHTQAGLRGSIEGHTPAISGLLAVELGRRWYRRQAAAEDAVENPGLDGSLDLLALTYSDFTYVEVWIMATWELSERVSMELAASYQPERHTERQDDTVLGYASLRLVWRP